MAREVWRQCVLVFAHGLGSRGGKCNGLLANTCLFLSTGNKYLFPPSTPMIPLRFSTDSIFHVWRQSLVIVVSDLYSFSPLSSNSDSWASITSDESPRRTILIRFWLDQTHVSSFCTDFPRFHRMVFFDIDDRSSSHLVSNS